MLVNDNRNQKTFYIFPRRQDEYEQKLNFNWKMNGSFILIFL